MALEVIGAGFSRNGTLSLRAAFEKLGYAPSYHMSEVIMPRPPLNEGENLVARVRKILPQIAVGHWSAARRDLDG